MPMKTVRMTTKTPKSVPRLRYDFMISEDNHVIAAGSKSDVFHLWLDSISSNSKRQQKDNTSQEEIVRKRL